jgi:hypothetical protein
MRRGVDILFLTIGWGFAIAATIWFFTDPTVSVLVGIPIGMLLGLWSCVTAAYVRCR